MRTLLAFTAAALVAPLVLVVLLMALPFWVVAHATARLALAFAPKAVPWQELITFEPVIGWRARPGLHTHALDFHGDVFFLHTDEQGWRGHGRIDDAPVVVFGDSFAFGHAVDNRDFFANVAGDLRIKTVAAPGYNMVQSLLWMERMAPTLTGRVAIWMLYPANDLEDNLRPQMQGYRMPFVREAGGGTWEIVSAHVRSEPWPFLPRRPNYESFVDICRGGYLSERAFAACHWLLARAQRVCTGNGVRLIVMTVPDLSRLHAPLYARVASRHTKGASFDQSIVDRRIAGSAKALGPEFVALRDVLGQEHYLEHDLHWNAAGHRIVAGVIRELLSAPVQVATPDAPSDTESVPAKAGRPAPAHARA